jgi:hypothetical protein
MPDRPTTIRVAGLARHPTREAHRGIDRLGRGLITETECHRATTVSEVGGGAALASNGIAAPHDSANSETAPRLAAVRSVVSETGPTRVGRATE